MNAPAPIRPHLSATTEIDAEPARLYELVADLPGMGSRSLENRGGWWLGSAPTPILGARFLGRNAHRLPLGLTLHWLTVSRVTVADPGRAFEFEVSVGPIPVARWGYTFEAGADGRSTRVTESWVDRRPQPFARALDRVFGTARADLNARGIAHTLAQLKQAAES